MFRYLFGSPNELQWMKGQKTAGPLVPNKTSVSSGLTFLDFCLYSYRKMNILNIIQHKCIRNQIWTCQRKGQGQPRFIVCANLDGFTSLMPHPKYQGHLPFGSREKYI